MVIHKLSKIIKSSFLLVSWSLFMASCGGLGKGSIKAPANLELTVTDSNYETISVLGDKTLKLDTKQAALWLKFEQPGAPTGYALLISPKHFEGENVEFKITPKAGVQSKENSTTTIGSSFYNEYFDLVLRGHRSLTAGDIQSAKDTIQVLREKYSETYGGLTLEMLVYITENNSEKIIETHDKIKRVYPESVLAKSLDGSANQEGVAQ